MCSHFHKKGTISLDKIMELWSDYYYNWLIQDYIAELGLDYMSSNNEFNVIAIVFHFFVLLE